MNREAKLWEVLNNSFRNEWDAERIENRVAPGFPDVSFGARGVNGFIELKHLPHWPQEGIINLARHFGPQFPNQRRWLQRRGRRGGHCFLFLWVSNDYHSMDSEWLLWDWEALEKWGDRSEVTVLRLQGTAIGHWRNWIHFPSLWDRLTT